jgi:hypothetical protein
MDRYLPSDPLDEPRGAPTILLIPELHPAIPMVPTPAIIKQGDGEELKLVEEMGIVPGARERNGNRRTSTTQRNWFNVG